MAVDQVPIQKEHTQCQEKKMPIYFGEEQSLENSGL